MQKRHLFRACRSKGLQWTAILPLGKREVAETNFRRVLAIITMMTDINTKIQPLIEDIGRIIPGTFLKSTEYKRWLVEHQLDRAWSQILSQVKSSRAFFAVGYDHDAADSKDTLGFLLNSIYGQRQDLLPGFLSELLSFYAEENTECVDVTYIKKDLLAASYSEQEVAVLHNISIPEIIGEKIEEEQSQEQKVRALEQNYLAHRDENSQEAINAYLEWHSAALLYLSNYYTEETQTILSLNI